MSGTTNQPARSLRLRVYERDDWTCRYCGYVWGHHLRRLPMDVSSGNRLVTSDHVIPVSRGGKNVLSNLVTACRECNQKRGNTGSENDALLAHIEKLTSEQGIFIQEAKRMAARIDELTRLLTQERARK